MEKLYSDGHHSCSSNEILKPNGETYNRHAQQLNLTIIPTIHMKIIFPHQLEPDELKHSFIFWLFQLLILAKFSSEMLHIKQMYWGEAFYPVY